MGESVAGLEIWGGFDLKEMYSHRVVWPEEGLHLINFLTGWLIPFRIEDFLIINRSSREKSSKVMTHLNNTIIEVDYSYRERESWHWRVSIVNFNFAFHWDYPEHLFAYWCLATWSSSFRKCLFRPVTHLFGWFIFLLLTHSNIFIHSGPFSSPWLFTPMVYFDEQKHLILIN